jgi:hypothetical protein
MHLVEYIGRSFLRIRVNIQNNIREVYMVFVVIVDDSFY